MPKFRYRTGALVGPWRDTPERARDDAVRAGQARPGEGPDIDWIIPGSIEQREGTPRNAGAQRS